MKIFSFIRLPLIACLWVTFSACGKSTPPRVADGSMGFNAELNRCLAFSSRKKHEEAVECLEVFKSRYPGGDQAAEAELMIGDSYFRHKEFLLAAETYQEFLRRYPYHNKIPYAYFKSGLAYLEENPKVITRDQQYLEAAVKNFAMVIEYFPSSTYAGVAKAEYDKARRRQAEGHYRIGKFYFKAREYIASVTRFTKVIQEFPDLGFDEESFYHLTMAYYHSQEMDKAKQVLALFEEKLPRSSKLKGLRSKLDK